MLFPTWSSPSRSPPNFLGRVFFFPLPWVSLVACCPPSAQRGSPWRQPSANSSPRRGAACCAPLRKFSPFHYTCRSGAQHAAPLRGLEFAEGCRHGEPRCADGGQQATNETHGKGKENTLRKQFGGDLEGEGQVGKSLKIHGACGQPIQWKNGKTADPAANEGNEKRFDREGNYDRGSAESECAHGGDLPAALGYSGIHRIQRAENRADGHDDGNGPAQSRDEGSHARGLFRVVVDFAGYVDVQTRIASKRVLQLLKGNRRSQVCRHGLRNSVRAIIGAVKKVGVAPDFGVKGTTARVENSHDLPTYGTKSNGVSQSQARIGCFGIFTDDEFGYTGGEHTPLYYCDIAANGKDVRRDTTKLHVGVGAGGTKRNRRHQDCLGCQQRG